MLVPDEIEDFLVYRTLRCPVVLIVLGEFVDVIGAWGRIKIAGDSNLPTGAPLTRS